MLKKKNNLVLCISSDDALYNTKFRKNILNGFKVMERTRRDIVP